MGVPRWSRWHHTRYLPPGWHGLRVPRNTNQVSSAHSKTSEAGVTQNKFRGRNAPTRMSSPTVATASSPTDSGDPLDPASSSRE